MSSAAEPLVPSSGHYGREERGARRVGEEKWGLKVEMGSRIGKGAWMREKKGVNLYSFDLYVRYIH